MENEDNAGSDAAFGECVRDFDLFRRSLALDVGLSPDTSAEGLAVIFEEVAERLVGIAALLRSGRVWQ